jgi:hypothetical protein
MNMAFLAGFLSLVFFFFFATPSFAVTEPTFPLCANTQGIVKSSYPSGTHGIAGFTGIFIGSDTVYTLTADTHIQCFCSVDGNGIQTNWWKVSSLTAEEIDTLLNLGWVYIPNGGLWGLEETPFLAQNTNYGCLPLPEVLHVSNKDSPSVNNQNNNSSGDVLGVATSGSVLGVSDTKIGEVLGLADTGGLATIYLYGGLGIISILLGYSIRGHRAQPTPYVKPYAQTNTTS